MNAPTEQQQSSMYHATTSMVKGQICTLARKANREYAKGNMHKVKILQEKIQKLKEELEKY